MFINYLSSASLFLRPIFDAIKKQDKLKIAISALACSILFGGAIYWACSRSWNQRRVQPELKPPSPIPQKKADDALQPELKPETKLPSPAQLKKADDAANHDSKENPEVPSAPKIQGLEDFPKQEPQEEKMEPSKIEKAEPLDEAIKPQVEIKTDICITSSMETGCVGNDPSKIPNIDQFTLEDGSPLQLIANDILLTLFVFNHQELPSTIYLPAALFSDKKDGDTLRFYFKGKLIELTINQAHHELKFEKGKFEEVLEQTIMAGQDKIEDQIGLFDRYDPFFYWNKFGDQTTSVYNLGKVAGCQFQLQEIPKDQLRPLQKTAIIHDPRLDQEDLEEEDRQYYLENQEILNIIQTLPIDIVNREEGWYLLANLPGFDANLPEDVDCIQIALNERRLGIHILRNAQKRSFTVKNHNKEGLEIEFFIKPKEFVRGLVWKEKFHGIDFEQLKAHLKLAQLTLEHGLFQIFIPKANPEAPLIAKQEDSPKEEELII